MSSSLHDCRPPVAGGWLGAYPPVPVQHAGTFWRCGCGRYWRVAIDDRRRFTPTPFAVWTPATGLGFVWARLFPRRVRVYR